MIKNFAIDFLVLMLNPFIYNIYFLKKKISNHRKILFFFSISLLMIYIPISWGDSQRHFLEFLKVREMSLKELNNYILFYHTSSFFNYLFYYTMGILGKFLEYFEYIFVVVFICLILWEKTFKNAMKLNKKIFVIVMIVGFDYIRLTLSLRNQIAGYIGILGISYIIFRKKNILGIIFILIANSFHNSFLIITFLFFISIIFLNIGYFLRKIKYFLILLPFIENFILEKLYVFFEKIEALRPIARQINGYTRGYWGTIDAFKSSFSSYSDFLIIFNFLCGILIFFYFLFKFKIKKNSEKKTKILYNLSLMILIIAYLNIKYFTISDRFFWYGINVSFLFLIVNRVLFKKEIFIKLIRLSFYLKFLYTCFLIILFTVYSFYKTYNSVNPYYIFPTIYQLKINNLKQSDQWLINEMKSKFERGDNRQNRKIRSEKWN